MQTLFNINEPMVIVFFVVLALWSLIWKGLALWRAARLKQKVWFIVILVLNTAGILEIIYLFVITKKDESGKISAAAVPPLN